MDNLPLVKIGEDAVQKPEMRSGPRKNLTIVVLGETSRGGKLFLNGYARETNPRLKQDNVIYFPDTTSCGTATAVSVPCMFSNMRAPTMMKSWRTIRKACWISCSAREFRFSGMITTAAVKEPATGYRTERHRSEA